MGVPTEPFCAVPARFTAEFDAEIETGSVWNYDIYNFIVQQPEQTEQEGVYAYRVECETGGTASGTVIQRELERQEALHADEPDYTPAVNITPVSEAPRGLSFAAITSVITEGEDEKTDDEIRETYYEYVNNSASDGNVAQYRRWCEEYEGIGAYKITPLWNGPNTVRVTILTASNRAVDTTTTPNLVSEFQEYLDPLKYDSEADTYVPSGMGDGAAPIGAFVTVDTASELPVSVSATVAWSEGYEHDGDALNNAVAEFFSDIAFRKSKVPYMSLGAAIDAVEGVDFISDLLINGGASDIALTAYQIPVSGTNTWTQYSEAEGDA